MLSGVRGNMAACLKCGKPCPPSPPRPQGGGTNKKYCSEKCRALFWVHKKNGKIIVPVENKVPREFRGKIARLKRLKMSFLDFEKMLDKCFYRCQGCNKPIDKKSACVDHDHETGRVRGLLCSHCNFMLGHAYDNKSILRQLMAYLDYDHTKTYIYLIGALKNPEIPKLAAKLRREGFEVWDDWHAAGEHADEEWQKYEQARGRTFQQALAGIHAQDVFYFDKSHLSLADKAVLVCPAGKSGHLELGYFVGTGKPGFILLDKEPDRYDIMPNFADLVCPSYDELLRRLKCVST